MTYPPFFGGLRRCGGRTNGPALLSRFSRGRGYTLTVRLNLRVPDPDRMGRQEPLPFVQRKLEARQRFRAARLRLIPPSVGAHLSGNERRRPVPDRDPRPSVAGRRPQRNPHHARRGQRRTADPGGDPDHPPADQPEARNGIRADPARRPMPLRIFRACRGGPGAGLCDASLLTVGITSPVLTGEGKSYPPFPFIVLSTVPVVTE